ncbi:MAG: hypothetical protein ACI4C7_09000 [Clostridia bacterium]
MTAILCVLAGAGIGLGVSIVLYILGFVVEILNCACQIISCKCDGSDALPFMWNGDTFFHVLLFCTIGGAVIGLIVGICKMKIAADEKTAKRNAANSEEARRQRERWAGEVKQKALNINNSCTSNNNTSKTIVSTSFKASLQMKEIMDELTKAAEIQGKVDSISNELAAGGIKQ